MTSTRVLALAAAVLALSGCAAKEKQAHAPVTVNATDSACEVSAAGAGAGPTTFVVTNTGTKVTEFYVYGPDDKVLGEVEDISPGLQRQLVVQFDKPATYRLACKPGMAGDGIRADFTVKP